MSSTGSVLHALRCAVRAASPPEDMGRSVSLGVAAIDGALGGGLAGAALHEVGPGAPLHGGAAAGFAVALAARALRERGQAVWIGPGFLAAQEGALYGPGLERMGLPMGRLVILRVGRPRDVLWAMEESLKCPSVGVVVAELARREADLTATRRLALAAREGGGIGILLHHGTACDHEPTTATTRWEVASIPGERDRFGGLGPTHFALSLVKNRRGRTGQWRLTWDHHERVFVAAASSLPVAPAACDGSPARIRVAGTG